jgi:spore germination cell wall hydrolase CwlJ-like protein
MYAEARGESLDGVIAIGEASKSRAKRTHKSICKISGVTRKNPPERLKYYWITFAKTILHDDKKPTIGRADSWNKGSNPSINHKDSKIVRKIGDHLFYVAGGELM